MTQRELDVVLYGATGFVGALTASHLATHAGPDVRIALAGRSQTKLESLRAQLGDAAAGWELVAVDAADTAGLGRLAGRAVAIASTIGPYARHGKELVRACAEQGTHYADLTGEVLFVRWSMDEVSAIAARAGARIVHSCGFDSIPSDLGVLVTAQQVAADGAGTLGETTLSVLSVKGGFSGGTIESGRQQMADMRGDADARRIVGDPYSLSPRRSEEPAAHIDGDRGALTKVRAALPVTRDARTGRWTGPFIMASFNTRIVRLSNTLSNWSYGREFRYNEVVDFGTGPLAPVRASAMVAGLGVILAGMVVPPTRMLIDKLLPKPGEGPSEEVRAAGRFRMLIRTVTTTGARYRTKVGADHDPGYNGTAIMLGESILSLALDGDRLPDRAGVLTPATAMGDVLVERLRTHGFVLDASPEGDHRAA